jgi:hypothetical protein
MAGSSSGGDVVEISCYSHRLAGRRHHGGGPHKPGRHHGSSCSGPRPIRPAHITRRELKCYCETTITAPNHSQQRELQCEVTEIQRPPHADKRRLCISHIGSCIVHHAHSAAWGAIPPRREGKRAYLREKTADFRENSMARSDRPQRIKRA